MINRMMMLKSQLIYCMYAECLMVSHGETRPDSELMSIKQRENLSSLLEVERTSDFKSHLQDNEKYLGAELLPAAHSANQGVKYKLANKGVDTVIVAPSVAAMQTAFDIFGNETDVTIFIQPLLQQRICSASSIPTDVSEIAAQFRSQPDKLKIEDSRWFLPYGNAENVDENRSPQEEVLRILRSKGRFETMQSYLDRNLNMRKELFDYHQKSKKKMAIVAHPQMLETLTATGWHENGDLVNPIRFYFAEVKKEHVFIDGVKAEAEESHVPFCG